MVKTQQDEHSAQLNEQSQEAAAESHKPTPAGQGKRKAIGVLDLANFELAREKHSNALEQLKLQEGAVVANVKSALNELEHRESKQQKLIDEFEETKQRMGVVHKFQTSRIKLNIGGESFTTSVETLKSEKDTMLAAMFSGRFELVPDDSGSFFIDRDGTHFRHILNYLRGCLNVDSITDQVRSELLTEATFYQLRGLIALLDPTTSNTRVQRELNYVIENLPPGVSSPTPTTVTHNSPGYAAYVMAPAISAPVEYWKCKVNKATKIGGWVGLGVIANPNPPALSYKDPSCYIWGTYPPQVYIAGNSTSQNDGWTGWQSGDVATFKLDRNAGTLTMHHARHQKEFTLKGLTATTQFRIHVNMYYAGDSVEIMDWDPSTASL
jgi:hypothetical protein